MLTSTLYHRARVLNKDTRNFDQSWLDLLWRHSSDRIDIERPQVDFGKLQDSFSSLPRFASVSGRSVFPMHIVLPEAYNFFADSYHGEHLLKVFENQVQDKMSDLGTSW